MRYKNLFWGILLITIGILWLLKSVSMVNFSWSDMIRLWPLILVWIGIGLLPFKDHWKILMDMLVLGFGIVLLFYPSHLSCSTTETESVTTPEYVYENADTTKIQTAEFSLDAGAGVVSLKPGANLIKVSGIAKSEYNLNIEQNSEAGYAHIELDQIPVVKPTTGKHFKVALSPSPIWKMNFNLGAIQGDFDLSEHKVSDLDINAGASELDLKIGTLHPKVNIDLSAGASSVKIAIPKSMKCIIQNESALSNVDFPGFTKMGKGTYQYNDPDSANTGCININIKSGASNCEITPYE
ncbi:MAG: DUF5668 domain-containing protein [Bacteroidales bacterium]